MGVEVKVWEREKRFDGLIGIYGMKRAFGEND